VFFTGCNLQCAYCQNFAISRICNDSEGIIVGRTVSVQELSEIFLDLQKQGAVNINLVTAFMFMPGILNALDLAKSNGLTIPVVYNSSGYESVELLKAMEGYIDIYLPDLKYVSADLASELSNAPDYPEVAKAAIAETIRQTKTIVRHLVLPGHVKESKRVLSYLAETYVELITKQKDTAKNADLTRGQDSDCTKRLQISIMSQYTPVEKALQSAYLKQQEDQLRVHPELQRRVTKREYDRVVDYAIELGITNAYIQDRAVATESFIPEWEWNER
nr:radical SAM protein [Lachnospiraceae bacterium]